MFREPHVFSQNVTISVLAFLCSRLLRLSRAARAATILQRAYRGFRAQRISSQKRLLSQLAKDCTQVVADRRRLLQAALLVQRLWRTRG